MTELQKLGQLMVCGVLGCEVDDDLRALVRERRIGNFILFSRSVRDAKQLRALCHDLRALALEYTGVPPLLSIDQEGGMVRRLPDDAANLPGAMALGAAGDPALTREAGRVTGAELLAEGLVVDYAPCADVNSNPRNPVIAVRSFGDDPRAVARHAAAFAAGLREGGVAACLKHFPGHGDTAVDSHLGLPRVDKTLAELEACELIPFRAGVEAGAELVMTSHILFPHIDPDGLPATMSRAILTVVLRERLGFDGVITTDCLEMDAIRARYGVAEGALGALRAGADLVTVSHTYSLAREASLRLERAAADGELPAARIEEALGRVLALKRRHMAPQPPLSTVGCPEHRALARRISEASLCATDAAPLPRVDGDAFFAGPPCQAATGVGDGERDAWSFPRHMGRAFGAGYAVCAADPDDAEIARVLALAEGRATAVVGLYNAQFRRGQLRLVEALRRAGHPVAAVGLRTPYELSLLPPGVYGVAAFEYTQGALDALEKHLRGELPARGRWPVDYRALARLEEEA